jgi:chemotaxis protein MotB
VAANDKKTTIVIKKIDGGGAGAHGGSWKVAFADFMTAMMCFFLVMWLTQQTPEVKAEVASYFSGPSMLEHDFTSYGAELTLEKLFLDLVNEPLKTAQTFLEPADFTPNVMAMGSKRMALAFVAAELGSIARDVTVDGNSLEFDIPEHYLFEKGTAQPTAQFVQIMTKLQSVTVGLEDSRVDIEATVNQMSVPGADYGTAQKVASQRKDMIGLKIKSTFEHPSNDIMGYVTVKNLGDKEGTVRVKISQKETTADGRKPRQLEDLYGDKNKELNVYNDFVKRVSNKDKDAKKTKK